MRINMPVILDAQGLNKPFGAVTAAKDVSAAIEKDSVVGLIGTNGAGKTTFINMITGYLKPDAGASISRAATSRSSPRARSRGWASAARSRSRSSTARSACSTT